MERGGTGQRVDKKAWDIGEERRARTIVRRSTVAWMNHPCRICFPVG